MLVVARVTRRTKYLWSEVWKEYRMIIKIFFFSVRCGSVISLILNFFSAPRLIVLNVISSYLKVVENNVDR